jgi:hypothetical protein
MLSGDTMNNSQCNILQLLLLFTITFMAGCARQHSVKVNDDTLSFYYRDSTAKEIFFAGSQDHFHSHPAIKGSDNIWKVEVPLKTELTYFFIVDGVVTVPDCPNTVLDDFGSKNCLYVSGM